MQGFEGVKAEVAPLADSPTIDAHGHGTFRNTCMIYGDFYRPIFLQEILEWFVRNANRAELATLRKAVSSRAASIRKSGGRRGRPRGRDDADWLVRAKIEAWQRIVDGWTWSRTAKAAGMTPTKPNIRTLSRRQDEYAAVIWHSCARLDTNMEHLARNLESKRLQQLLWVETGLPFSALAQSGLTEAAKKDFTEGCKKIVRTLAPRGFAVAAGEIQRHLSYLSRKKTKLPPSLSVKK